MEYLYLILSGKYLKIGCTKNLTKRIKQYLTHNPDYKVLHIREGTRSDEYYLHKRLKSYLIGDTEWMIFTLRIIDIFKSIKLNHTPTVSNDTNKRRKKKRLLHINYIKKRRKLLKEAKTIFITKNGIRKSIF